MWLIKLVSRYARTSLNLLIAVFEDRLLLYASLQTFSIQSILNRPDFSFHLKLVSNIPKLLMPIDVVSNLLDLLVQSIPCFFPYRSNRLPAELDQLSLDRLLSIIQSNCWLLLRCWNRCVKRSLRKNFADVNLIKASALSLLNAFLK